MRRRSIRKAAVTRAKLANSIRPIERKLGMELMETLETRTLFAVVPQATVSANINVTTIAGNDVNPSIAIDRYDPSKLVAVWTNDNNNNIRARAAFSSDGGQTWA